MVVRGRRSGSHHVAISGRPHPGPAQCRGPAAHGNLRRSKAQTALWRRCAGATATAAAEAAHPMGHLFSCSSAPIPTPIGWRAPAWRWTTRASCHGWRRWAAHAGDQPRRRLRHRRRARRLGQARCRRGRRGRAGGRGAAWLPGASASRFAASTDRRSAMATACSHLATIRKVTPSALGCEECLKMGDDMGSPAPLPHLWPCRLLRRFQEQACHQAFSPHQASDHRRLRSAGRLGLVLCRRSDVRPLRPT